MSVVVECTGLTKDYRTPAEIVHALQGVDLTIQAGEFLAFMGPSGSGKTTLLNVLGTMDAPSGGECVIAGQRLSTMNEEAKRRLRRDRIGFIFQEFHLVPTLTALENVMLPALFGGEAISTARARELLGLVGLADRVDHLPRALSGGQKQRVAIARALAHSPALVLADEPTGNLDSETGLGLMQLFRRLVSETGVTILMVTHDTIMAQTADRIVRMRDGRIVAEPVAV